MPISTQIDRLAGVARHLVIASAMFLVLGPARADTSPTAVTEARNKMIVREAFDKWRGGGNVFTELLVPDIVWTIHGSGPGAGTYRNRTDFVQQAAVPLTSRLATPLVPNLHHIWAEGDRVIVRFDAAATTTSGARYANQFVWIFRMKDGAVVEAEAFLDLAAYQKVIAENAPRTP